MTKNVENMLTWLKDNGALVDDIYFKQHKKERSVFTHKSINSGHIPIKIPLSCIIHDGLGEKSKYGIMFNNNDHSKIINKKLSLIAIFMLEEMRKQDSFFFPYFNSLPDDVSNFPVFWDTETLSLLKGSKLLNDIENRKKEFVNDYEIISACCKGFSQDYSFEEFLYVRILIGSRNFGITIDGIKRSSMVPLADMLNHSVNNNIIWYFNDSNKFFEMTANTFIGKGIELEDTYGKKNNSKMLIYYGFLLDDNPLDYIKLVININGKDHYFEFTNSNASIKNVFNQMMKHFRTTKAINHFSKNKKEISACNLFRKYLETYMNRFEKENKLLKGRDTKNTPKSLASRYVLGEIKLIKLLDKKIKEHKKTFI
tara:strand:+ start:115 stop:1221 length:1107 start_codon:yes stop_codon:yes gene_type:complete